MSRPPARRPIAPILVVVAGAVVVVAAAAGLALTTGALGPSSSPNVSHLPVAVCDLLADPEGAFGRAPIASPSTYTVGVNDRCQWVLQRDPTRYVGVTVGPASNHEATIAALGPGEPVELGDAARWWAGNATLSVVTGDRNFQVDLRLNDDEITLELATAVARQVLAALGGS